EADPAALQVAAQRRGGFALVGAGVVRRVLDCHRTAVYAFADEVVIEGARALGRVDAAQILGDGGRAGDGHAEAALLPEQVLQQALDITVVGGGIGVLVGRQDGRAINGDGPALPLQRDGQ